MSLRRIWTPLFGDQLARCPFSTHDPVEKSKSGSQSQQTHTSVCDRFTDEWQTKLWPDDIASTAMISLGCLVSAGFLIYLQQTVWGGELGGISGQKFSNPSKPQNLFHILYVLCVLCSLITFFDFVTGTAIVVLGCIGFAFFLLVLFKVDFLKTWLFLTLKSGFWTFPVFLSSHSLQLTF